MKQKYQTLLVTVSLGRGVEPNTLILQGKLEAIETENPDLAQGEWLTKFKTLPPLERSSKLNLSVSAITDIKNEKRKDLPEDSIVIGEPNYLEPGDSLALQEIPIEWNIAEGGKITIAPFLLGRYLGPSGRYFALNVPAQG